ncbi:MAG TPA: TOMM precursor leader peptide-binding protein [Cellvibrio sp.]|nr:TOMM precursor leader peptide-binding protein [Cellvibrio sp.]
MLNTKLQWHPQFIKHLLPDGNTLLLNETDQYLIASDEFSELDKIIKGNGFSSDFIFNAQDIVSQVRRMQRLDGLFAEQILAENITTLANQYHLIEYNKAVVTLETNDVVVHSLSEAPYSLNTLLDLLSTFIIKPAAIVIIDDFLDPRLQQINQQLMREKKSWLLIKPAGKTPAIGPLFLPDKQNSPCYECMRFRIIQNNPVREWLMRLDDAQDFYPVPILVDQEKITKALESFKEYCTDKRFNEDALYKAHISYEYETESIHIHLIQPRPQCPCCGDSAMIARIHSEPIRLQDCFRHKTSDGGYRINNAETTVATLKQFISPIAGVLTDISDITPESTQHQLSIYRAAYFQNTFKTDTPTADTFVQLSLGKGISKHQAMASALGEALERHAAQFTGEEATHFSARKNLPARAIAPHELNPFSQEQYQQFSQRNSTSLLEPQWVTKYEDDIPLHWLQGWSLTGNEPVYFPAAHCLANTPFADHVYSLYSHNGNAAGVTLEEAILQGALELIERDAVAIWWYNQIPRPEISAEIIPDNYRNTISATLDAEWEYWLLDVTHDIPVTTCVAVGQHKITEKFVLGFGSHLEPAIAAQRALTEMYQLITIKDKVTGPFEFNKVSAHPFLMPKRKTAKKIALDFSNYSETNIKNDILFVMELLKKSGLELCVVNYSRPELPLYTVKVIVPGLCHMWPQFANKRLYQVPVDLGWLSKPLNEPELNPMNLYL